MDEMFASLRRQRPDIDPARLERTRALMATALRDLRDFPPADLRSWDIDPKSPDEFVRDQISLDRGVVMAALQQVADSWRNPPGTIDDVLDRLERSGLAVSIAELRARPLR
jgi:hypothetical protein